MSQKIDQSTPSSDIYINKDMLEYMQSIDKLSTKIRSRNAKDFQPTDFPEFNKRAREGNYYIKDIYGLIIRKKEYNNPKSPFGWVRDSDDNIVNIHIPPECPEDNIYNETIIKISNRFATAWNNPKDILHRIYKVGERK